MNTTRKRCPNGFRRNKKTGECENKKLIQNIQNKSIQNESIINLEDREDSSEKFFSANSGPEKDVKTKKKRCPKGTRRNKKSGNCEPTNEPTNELTNKKEQSHNLKNKNIKTKPPSMNNMIKTPSIVKKHIAAKKIQMFMNRTKHKRTALFLKTICSDSGVCIAFGKESDKIKHFFNGFTDFSYVVDKKMIGKVSANGFVYEISYSHKDYNAHTILKSSRKQNADNLMYEYAVGKKINTMFNKFSPCFLETYGLYKYKNETEWDNAINNTDPTKKLGSMIVKQNDINYEESCLYSKLICVLVQHIKDSRSLGSYINSIYFLQNHLLYVLYQVYFTLSVFSTQFTHYDLHLDNVILFEPIIDKYIQYHYHFPGGETVSFKSSYIAKIIDYGRCYVSGLSDKYYEDICNTKECNPMCGYRFGYAWFMHPTSRNYFISSQYNNSSHDLRLLKLCKTSDVKNSFIDLYNVTKKIVYGTPYGTKENKTSGYPNAINNVVDAEKSLRDIMLQPNYIASNNHIYTGSEKLGDLHVYSDREMNFVPAV
jgi:hypothetical protein